MIQTGDKQNPLALRKEMLLSRTGEVLPVSARPQLLLPTALINSGSSAQASGTFAAGGLRSPSPLEISGQSPHSAVQVPRTPEVSCDQDSPTISTAARARTSIASGGLQFEPSLEGGLSLDRLSDLSAPRAVSTDLERRIAANPSLFAATLLCSLLKTVQQMQSAFVIAAAQLADNSGIAESRAMEDTMCAGLNALTLVEA